MHIFIDESGQFIPLDGAKSRAAAALALVVPSSSQGALRREFRKLKPSLGSPGRELKGSTLSETQAARIIDLLAKYDVIVEAVVLDAGAHSSQEVTKFKHGQAERLMTHITRDHQASLIQDLISVQENMKRLPNQLFLQIFAIWQLIPRVLETATMYYSQRRPAELGSFVWRVDAKDAQITTMEELWTWLIGPLITGKSEVSPWGMLPGADYSYLERFDFDTPPEGVPVVTDRHYTDLKKVLREDFSFAPSERDLGLQLADMIASILTRALNGTLQKAGWESLGRLFVRRPQRTVRVIALSWPAPESESSEVENHRWISVIQRVEEFARPMLTSRSLKLADEHGPNWES